MNIYKRFLFVIPFLIAAYFFAAKQLADNDCRGLVDFAISIAQIIFCTVTFIIALIATLRKRESAKLKIEPITGKITLLTLLTIFVCGLYADRLKGKVLLLAESENFSHIPGGQKLKFRENGRVTLYKIETDFSCYETSGYKIIGDTFLLDKTQEVFERGIVSNKYVKTGHNLIPLTKDNLIDTSKQVIKFVIDVTE